MKTMCSNWFESTLPNPAIESETSPEPSRVFGRQFFINTSCRLGLIFCIYTFSFLGFIKPVKSQQAPQQNWCTFKVINIDTNCPELDTNDIICVLCDGVTCPLNGTGNTQLGLCNGGACQVELQPVSSASCTTCNVGFDKRYKFENGKLCKYNVNNSNTKALYFSE